MSSTMPPAAPPSPPKSILKSSLKSPGSKKSKGRVSMAVGTFMSPSGAKRVSKSIQVKSMMRNEGVKWTDDVDVRRISRLRASVMDDLFYTDEEMAEFKYEAFMEEAGLDPTDFE